MIRNIKIIEDHLGKEGGRQGGREGFLERKK